MDTGHKKSALFLVGFVIFFAIALQTQVSLFVHDGYRGLRINVADFGLPVAGAIVLFSLFTKRSFWPVWRVSYTYVWLAVLTIIMTVALFNGYFVNGVWSRWAFLNKYTGWFILLAYFCWGGWLSTNFGERLRSLFLKAFLYFFCAVIFVSVPVMLAGDLGLDLFPVTMLFSGLMGNRNAFALLLVCGLVLMTVFEIRKKPLLPAPVFFAVWTVLPLTMMYNGSRAGLLVVPLLLVLFLFLNVRTTLTRIVPCVLAGMLFVMLLFAVNPDAVLNGRRNQQLTRWYANTVEESQLQLAHAVLQKTKYYQGDQVRFNSWHDGFSLWRNAPIFGAGLGSYLIYEEQNEREIIDIIDSTPLWILTEMGLVGFFAFAAFYTLSLLKLWKTARTGDDEQAIFSHAVVIILLCFGLMSLVHEFLYTRHIWFILGLALANNALDSSSEGEKTLPEPG